MSRCLQVASSALAVPHLLAGPSLCCAALILLAAIGTSTASAQSNGACQVSDYKVLSPDALAINCSRTVTAAGRAATITIPTAVPAVNASFGVYSYAGAQSWLLLYASGSAGSFAFNPQNKYSLVLTYQAPDAAHPGQLTTTPEPPFAMDLSGIVTITPSVVALHPSRFRFTSHVGFADSSGRLEVQANPGDVGSSRACSLPLESYSQVSVPLTGKCFTFAHSASTLPVLQMLDPELVGRIDMDLSGVSQLQSSLVPTGLPAGSVPSKNIFGVVPKIDPKSRISPQKAPATKDGAQVYLNLNYAAGTGTAPGWQLDGKVAPIMAMVDRFAIGPLATANVGGNKVPGQTYTDSIDLGGTSQRIYQPGGNDSFLPLLSFSAAATYETDKEFNRDNVLGSIDFKGNFKGLYNTQSSQAQKQYYKVISSLGPADPKPQLSDMPVPKFGAALDFHAGIEAGRAIIDKTVNATSGKASLVLPAYSIFRVVPQVHGILQVWKFSTDTLVVGRYLVATENTVLQAKTNALYLEHLNTWRGICTASVTYADSSASHVGLTITYNNGFAPPTYARVNSVQAGLLIKY